MESSSHGRRGDEGLRMGVDSDAPPLADGFCVSKH